MDYKNIHFLGIKWRDEKPVFIYRPDRRVDEESSFELKSGEPVTITISGERYCIGDNGPCPYDRILTSKNKRGNKCFVCGQKDFVQYMPLKALNAEQHEILKGQPHFNYINLFGPEILKVGVASQKNKRKRVLEQGAFATMYFTEGDGFTVRQIEDMVSIMLKFTQHVAWTAKYKVINLRPTDEAVKGKLENVYTEIAEIMPERFQENLLKMPEIVINSDKYHINLPPTLTEIRSIDTFATGDVISGTIVGLYGLVILIENELGFFALNTRNLEGFILDVDNTMSVQHLVTPAKSIQIQKPEFTVDLF
jgi:hypothetical protein